MISTSHCHSYLQLQSGFTDPILEFPATKAPHLEADCITHIRDRLKELDASIVVGQRAGLNGFEFSAKLWIGAFKKAPFLTGLTVFPPIGPWKSQKK